MNQRLSRRRALTILSATTSAMAAGLLGAFPEIQIGRAGTLRQPDRPPVLRRFSSDRAASRFGITHATARGAQVRSFLARHGFTTRPTATEAAELLYADGEEIGHIVGALYHDPRARRFARVVYQSSGERDVTGVTLWSEADPLRREVYDLRGRTFQLSATLVGRGDGSLVIERPDGTQMNVPARPDLTQAGGRYGVARPMDPAMYAQQYCSWVCFLVFEWVCTTVLIETCAISAACGPLAILCAGACVIAVIASCAWNATNYCSWSCTWISSVTEQTSPA